MQKSRQDNVAKQRKPESRINNCGAIATLVANFCRVDFSSPGYGKPKLRRVWPIPIIVLDARTVFAIPVAPSDPVGCHGRLTHFRFGRPIDACPADSQKSANLACAFALGFQSYDCANVNRRPSSLVNASGFRFGNPLHLPLFSQARLKFCEDAQHVQKRLARCGCGVNRLICGFKRNGFAFERSNNILKVRHRPSQPVNSGHNERVARPKELQKCFQLAATFPGCAGPLFRTDNFASGPTFSFSIWIERSWSSELTRA